MSGIIAEDIDEILRDGGNRSRSPLRTTAYYMKGKSLEKNVAFLRREYRSGGKGYRFGHSTIAVWWDENGMTFARGTAAQRNATRVHLPWEQVAVRIHELLVSGQYVTREMLNSAPDNERAELADRIYEFYRSDLGDFHEMPMEWKSEHGSVPDDIAVVKNLLDIPAERERIIAQLCVDIASLKTEPDAPTHFWHDPARLLEDASDLLIDPISFTPRVDSHTEPYSELHTEPHLEPRTPFSRFITQDEIDAFFIRGRNYAQGKLRIFSHFLHNHSAKENADLIKERYHNSGSSHALSGADDSWYDGLGGSIELRRAGCEDVNLSWNAAAKRIETMIRENRYMSDNDFANMRPHQRSDVTVDM